MHNFTDATGQKWSLSITIGDIKPIEAETGVNLLKMDKPFEQDAGDWKDDSGQPLKLYTRLELDLELCFSVIYAACIVQAKERGLDEVAFGRRLTTSEDGHDAHQAAYEAFWLELEDFFRRARRLYLVKILQKQRAIVNQAMRKVEERTDAINTEKVIETNFGDSSGPMPALSASTLDP